MKKRVFNIFKDVGEELDAIVIKNSSEPFIDNNFFYVTGLTQGLFEGAVAMLFPDGSMSLLVSSLEAESAKKSDADVLVYKTSVEYAELFKDCLNSCKNIGLNFNNILYKDYLNIKKELSGNFFSDVSTSFKTARCIKDKIELELIGKAAAISDKAMAKISDFIYEDMSEYSLAAEINHYMQKNGASGPAFDTISSFGKNTAEPHYTHGDTKLRHGDFILCDFGACYKKYNSDITRTFVYKESGEKQKRMYSVVSEAQQIAFDQIRAGVKACDVHNAVSAFIDSSEFKGCFIHGTGHSLGLSVHDPGVAFRTGSEVVLEENMVITVEPGVYIPGFGGVRIEDDIVVKKDGFEFITKSCRDFLEI